MKNKKGWALFLAAVLFTGILTSGVKAASLPENTSHGLSNPRNDKDNVTWDCVYFGKYWQSDTNGDGAADKNDEKESIKWRVLSVDGEDAFLVVDTNLDVQRYNDTPTLIGITSENKKAYLVLDWSR